MNRFNIFRRLLALSCLCALLLSAPASMGTLSPETVAFQKKDPLFAQLGSRYRAALTRPSETVFQKSLARSRLGFLKRPRQPTPRKT